MDDNDIADLVDGVTVPPKVAVYLGRTEVAAYMGLKSMRSLNGVVLPPHDAEIGDRKGWTTATIDAWLEARPGRGRWGARRDSHSDVRSQRATKHRRRSPLNTDPQQRPDLALQAGRDLL